MNTSIRVGIIRVLGARAGKKLIKDIKACSTYQPAAKCLVGMVTWAQLDQGYFYMMRLNAKVGRLLSRWD